MPPPALSLQWWRITPWTFNRHARHHAGHHPAEVMGRKAAISGARRDSNPFLRYPMKASLRTQLIDHWDRGWTAATEIPATG